MFLLKEVMFLLVVVRLDISLVFMSSRSELIFSMYLCLHDYNTTTFAGGRDDDVRVFC